MGGIQEDYAALSRNYYSVMSGEEEVDKAKYNELQKQISLVYKKIAEEKTKTLSSSTLDQLEGISKSTDLYARGVTQIFLEKVNAPACADRETVSGLDLVRMLLGKEYEETYATTSLAQIESLGEGTDQYVHEFLDFLKRNHVVIPLSFPTDLSDERRQFIQKVLTDVILLTSVQPFKTDREMSGLPSRIATIAPFCFENTLAILSNIDNISNHLFISQINQSEYDGYTISQKIYVLSTAKVGHTDSHPQDLEIYQALLSYPNLKDLLFVSSYMTTQTHMNSCTLASINQEMLIKLSSIPSLSYLADRLIKDVEERLSLLSPDEKSLKILQNTWGFGGVTKEVYIRHVCEKTKKALFKAERKLIERIQQGKLGPQDIKMFLKVWNKSMQQLHSIVDFNDIVYLTKKPLDHQWLASAAIMFVPSVLGGIVANYPSVSNRLIGFGPDTIRSTREFLDSFITCPSKVSPVWQSWEIEDKLQSEESTELLWQTLLEKGGAYWSRTHHVCYLKAIMVEEKKQFALAEVKQGEYIILDKTRLRELVSES